MWMEWSRKKLCVFLISYFNIVCISAQENSEQKYEAVRQQVCEINHNKVKAYKNLDDKLLSSYLKVLIVGEKETLLEKVNQEKNEILKALETYGAVLIRNAINCEECFVNIFPILYENDFEFSTEKGDNTPRSIVYPNILNASEVPKEFYLHQHNEDTFLRIYPKTVAFYCSTPPPDGEGATPLAKNEDIHNSIPKRIIEKIPTSTLRFIRYVPSATNAKVQEINRVFKLVFATHNEMLSTVDKVFPENTRKEIESFIIHYFGLNLSNPNDYLKWDSDGNLEFSVEAEKMHPPLGNIIRAAQEVVEKNDDNSWCKVILEDSQFDVSAEFEKATSLSGSFASSLEDEDLIIIGDALVANTYRFQWKQGDLLILNNEKITHGREPFSKNGRKILVSKGRHNNNNTLGVKK